jgi:hypothetical protein
MQHIDTIIRQINNDLVPHFEERLRASLAMQEKEWLIEQVIHLSRNAYRAPSAPLPHRPQTGNQERADRLARLRQMALDRTLLLHLVEGYEPYDRARLIQEGYLLPETPAQGTELIGEPHRSPEGNVLLQEAKDVLFGLLFGDESTNTRLDRHQRELLTFAVPRFKAGALDFMQAATQFSAAGTWQDPERVSHDERADNAIFEIEYGEIEGELVGRGIVQALRLINYLEVNEQILYARMIDVEESTLIV